MTYDVGSCFNLFWALTLATSTRYEKFHDSTCSHKINRVDAESSILGRLPEYTHAT